MGKGWIIALRCKLGIKAKPTGDILTPAGKLHSPAKSEVLHREQLKNLQVTGHDYQ